MPLRPPRPLLAASIGLLVAVSSLATVAPASAAEPDLARQGTATASQSQSDQDGNFPAENAIDGDATTRWASGNGPDDTSAYTADLTVDLGSVATVSSVDIAWEAAYAKGYEVQVATADPSTPSSWTTAKTEAASDGETDSIVFASPVQARYVRLAMLQRIAFFWEGPDKPHYYGYSVFSFEVHGVLAKPSVGFATSKKTVKAGEDAAITIDLAGTSDSAQSVTVKSGGGSAVAGTDYTALDTQVDFAAGDSSATVTVPTVSRGALSPVLTFDLTLSNPSDGIILGSKTTTTITLKPTGELPNSGATRVFEDFENGVPADYSTWASADPLKPVLSTTVDATPPGAGADNHVLTATVSGTPDAGSYFGFTNDRAAANWSTSDGFSFRFLGQSTGKSLGFELKNGNQLFDQTVVDDTTGWRTITVLFSDLRLKNNHASSVRFDPTASTGFAVTLTGMGAGTFSFDDFALFDRVFTLEDFQGDVPLSTSANPVGFFTWGSADNLVTIGVNPQERGDVADNKVLSGSFQIPDGGYGGFSDNLAVSQDWSSFRGIRFWWYASQASNPASPTAGDDIKVEIKDGGPDGEHSELWATTFKDNWGSSTSRWKLVELPFSKFALGSYQPGNAETKNGTLDLTSAWGFAPTFTPGKPTATGWAVDDVQLYGTPAAAATVTVAATQDVYLVDQGDAASVGLKVTTPSGDPLESDVTITYAPGDGTAVAGTNYTDFSGSITFPAGTESGTVKSFDVSTLSVSGGDVARDISIALTASGVTLPENGPRVVVNAHDLPYLDASLSTTARVDDLLGRMSLAQKAGQMAQAERLGLASTSQIASLGLGSLLSGGGSVPAGNTPEAWAKMIDGYQRQALSTSLQIPLLYGADAVHGHSNVLDATIFPHNIGLGATRDPALVEEIARVTAIETKATGVNWAFAPCLCVSRDERWGRTYESFGEDPALVESFAEANTVGLQGDDPTDKSGPDKVLATAKHWAGDGGTAYDASKAGSGYPIDQGLTTAPNLAAFEKLFVDPYKPSIAAGVGTIMPSYSGVNLLDDGKGDVRMHENTLLNTTVLKGELGFSGFLISDWEGIDKLPGGTYANKVERSVNSGLDMAMAPYNFGAFITAVEDGVDGSRIAESRVNDAVRRILIQKFELGLFEQPLADTSKQSEFGGAAHRAVARTAAAESQVLLKNDGVLPLAKTGKLYLAGSNADDLGNQMGGWSISWQGGSGDTTTGTSIREGIAEVAPNVDVTYSKTASAPTAGFDTGIVVVGETPYAEGQGDVGNNGKSLSLSTADRAAIDTVCAAMKCVVLVVAGRTQLVTDKVDTIDGLVASFLPGTEGAGVADTLFGAVPFTGRLPLTWPATAAQVPINVGDATYSPLYAYGWGVRTDAARDRLETVADALSAGAALDAVNAALAADIWSNSGGVKNPGTALPLLKTAAGLVSGANADLVVSVARDLAQAVVIAGTAPTGSSADTADAEHALLAGDPAAAVALFAKVVGDVPAAIAQSISFAALPTKNFGDSDFAVRATASSGLAVSFAASGACTISGSKVHLGSAGSCTITARQGGDGEFAAATPVSRTFTVRTKVLDSFTRRDGHVSSQWTGATSERSYRIDSRALNVGRGGDLAYGSSYGTTQEATVTLAKVDRGSRSQGVLLKVQSGSLSKVAGIRVVYDAKSKTVEVTTKRGDGKGNAYEGKKASFSNGDVLTARVTATGTVVVSRNGATVSTVTMTTADKSYFAARGGRIGLTSSDASGAVFDTFRGGTIR